MDQNHILRDQIRNYLNIHKIKLWTDPFSLKDGSLGNIPMDLIMEISSVYKIHEPSIILTILEELRIHSIEKLAAQKKFNETGIAQIRVKVAGSPHNLVPLIDLSHEIITEIDVNKNGKELMNEISKITGIPESWLKFIINGRALQENSTLISQQIKNYSQVLVLCLSASEVANLLEDERQSNIDKVKKATEFLVDESNNNDIFDDSRYQLQIADQHGRPIQIPLDEQKALAVAMLFHEKGRVALKKKNYNLALTYLSEADSQFGKCSSTILDHVNNFALVCLDLVWCYLALQNMSHLPDAEKKLKIAEKSLVKSYGQNLERVSSLKGSCEQERALFLRLHILQAVVAFHHSRYSDSKELLIKAETDLKRLKVDETQLLQMAEFGFDLAESRLALRFANGDITRAVAHVAQLKENKAAQKLKEKTEKEAKKLEKKLGLTSAGSKISVSLYQNLTSMGFDRRVVAWALKETDNDCFNALKHIQENLNVDPAVMATLR